MRISRPVKTALIFSVAASAKRIVVGTSNAIVSFNFDTSSNTLTRVSQNSDLIPNPSWQQWSVDKKFLLSTNEGYWGRTGNVGTFRVADDGSLTRISSASGLFDMMSVTDNGAGKLFTASYNGNGINSFRVTEDGQVSAHETVKFQLPARGPNPRQDSSHPHQALMDPTSRYLFVPDLGADLTRVFDASGETLSPLYNIVSAPGAGPRHAKFWPDTPGEKAEHLFIVNELGNTLTAFSVEYSGSENNITVTPTQTVSTFGTRSAPAVQPAPTAAEIAISPVGKFLYTSNRSDKLAENGAADSLAVFSLNNGTLNFLELTSAGGFGPRHFSIDPSGEYLGSALGASNKIVIFKRDAESGKLQKVAEATATTPSSIYFLD